MVKNAGIRNKGVKFFIFITSNMSTKLFLNKFLILNKNIINFLFKMHSVKPNKFSKWSIKIIK